MSIDKPTKRQISERALLARVNRRLAKENCVMRRPRSERGRLDLGNYYVVTSNNTLDAYKIDDLEAWVRQEMTGVLQSYETVAHS